MKNIYCSFKRFTCGCRWLEIIIDDTQKTSIINDLSTNVYYDNGNSGYDYGIRADTGFSVPSVLW